MKFNFFIREGDKDFEGLCIIQMSYTHDSKRFRTPLYFDKSKKVPIKCKCSDFIKSKDFEKLKRLRKLTKEDRPQRVRLSSGVDAIYINAKLDEIETRVQKILQVLRVTDPSVSRFKKEFFVIGGNSRVLYFLDEYIKEKKDLGKSNSTISNLRKLKNRLIEFNPSMTFADLDEGFMKRYQKKFKSSEHKLKRPLSQATLKLDADNLSAFLTSTLGIYHYNTSYKKWKVQKGASRDKYLTRGQLLQIEAIKDFQWENDHKVRDILLFLCFSGLRIEEYLSIKKEDVSGIVLKYEQKKQREKKENRIVLNGTLERIWNRYEGELPKFSKTHINRRINYIGSLINLSYRISSSIGRHTFATLSEEGAVSTEKTSKTLGHSGTKITKKYIHASSENDSTLAFEDYVRGKEA